MLLAACGLESLLQQQVTATIDNTDEIGGDACPLLVTTSDGQHLEVTLPDGYQLRVRSGALDREAGVTGPGGLVAGTGDLIRITLTDRQPAQSPCKWGYPVEASRISRP